MLFETSALTNTRIDPIFLLCVYDLLHLAGGDVVYDKLLTLFIVWSYLEPNWRSWLQSNIIAVSDQNEVVIHSKKKKTFQALFFGASDYHKQGTRISTWVDQSVAGSTIIGISYPPGPQYCYHGASSTDRSFQILTQVPYLWQAEAPKKMLLCTFCS